MVFGSNPPTQRCRLRVVKALSLNHCNGRGHSMNSSVRRLERLHQRARRNWKGCYAPRFPGFAGEEPYGHTLGRKFQMKLSHTVCMLHHFLQSSTPTTGRASKVFLRVRRLDNENACLVNSSSMRAMAMVAVSSVGTDEVKWSLFTFSIGGIYQPETKGRRWEWVCNVHHDSGSTTYGVQILREGAALVWDGLSQSSM